MPTPDKKDNDHYSLNIYNQSKIRLYLVRLLQIIAVILIIIVFILQKKADSELKIQNMATFAKIAVNPVTINDHILGNPNAPVKIIEFSDPECPFCKQFHATMHQIVDTYGKTGQVAWIYREYPIPSLHKRAPNEVEAMECAGGLGGNAKFWAYTDEIFSITQSNDTLDPSELPIIAKDVGLDINAFNSCLLANKYVNLITTESLDSVRAGANGTPFSVLIGPKGEKILFSGAQPLSVMKSLIDSELNQIPSQSY